eukprot:6214435-Pleurochrysis_carterae.AAC.3
MPLTGSRRSDVRLTWICGDVAAAVVTTVAVEEAAEGVSTAERSTGAKTRRTAWCARRSEPSYSIVDHDGPWALTHTQARMLRARCAHAPCD